MPIPRLHWTPTNAAFFGFVRVNGCTDSAALARSVLEEAHVVTIPTKPFFGLSVCSPEHLDGLALNGQPFDRLVVMSFGNTDALRAEALARRVPLDHVFRL